MRVDHVTEAERHAYVDDRLPPDRRAAVEADLNAHPDERERLADYQALNEELRRLFDPLLEEPIPMALRLPPPVRRGRSVRFWLSRAAAIAGLLLLGGTLGWFAREQFGPSLLADRAFVQQALAAHAVYVPEIRHPVEVDASQRDHLVAWLTKRLNAPVRAPALETLGFQLLGGRLLPGDGRPAAQFMYEDGAGRRLTLYVRRGRDGHRETAFRIAEQDGVSAFYWIDGDLAYALIGDLDRLRLDQAARAVYQQLNP